VQLGTGDTILFWEDLWNGQILKFKYLELHSFAINKSITAQRVQQADELDDIFQLPLSEVAYEQYCELEIYIHSLEQDGSNDRWSYIWGNGNFSSQKVYIHLCGSKSACQTKHKVFFWLLLMDRLNTRGLLERKNMYLESYSCELCLLQTVGTLRHLFLKCGFANQCWGQIGVNVLAWLRPKRVVRHIKRSLGVFFSMEIIIVMCWCIWKERND
jgi:hypothetical protein